MACLRGAFGKAVCLRRAFKKAACLRKAFEKAGRLKKLLEKRPAFALCLSESHLADSDQSLANRRDCDDQKGNDSLGEEIETVIGQRVEQGLPGEIMSGEADPLRVDAKKDDAGEHGEEIATENSEDITLDETIFGPGEEPGESKGTEGQNVVTDHLGKADDVRA